ncbi:MAG TPA: hypothetical protein VMV18_12440, partial [bacterium]|nr:hypothetical protein [bacterium]
ASAFDVASLLAGRFRHADPFTPELAAGHARFIRFLATQVFIAYAAAMAIAALAPGDVLGVVAAVTFAVAARFVVAWVGYPGADSVRHLLAVGDPMLFLVPALCAAAGAAGCRWVRFRVRGD